MSGTAIPTIPAPVTANPEFYRQGIEGLNALRDQQAKQASADAYRQSINPDGTINTPKYNALIASGPGAWNAGPLMEQQGRAAGAQAEAGSAQADQAQKIYNFVAAPSASLMNDPSDANLANIRSQLVTAGAPPGVIAEVDRMKTLSEADRRTVAYQHNLSAADTQHRLAAGGFAMPTVTQFGGTSAPVTLQPGTPYGPPRMTVGGGVAHTVSPGEYNAPQESPILLDANGQVTNDPTKAVSKVDRTVPRGPAFGMPPPGSVGGAPSSAAQPPPPPPGTQVRPPPATTPAAAAPPSATSTSTTLRGPGSSATPPAAPPPTVAPSSGGVVTGLPTGTEKATEATAGQSAALGTALTTRADQVPTNKANYANMLTDLSKLDTMGPGTEKEVALNAAMQKLTGYGFSMNREQVAAGNSFAKLANIAVGQQLQSIGGTDARQALFMGANPHLDLSKLGNQQIIHMLQGNEDAIQAKSRAWQDWQKGGRGPDTYASFQDDFNHHFDPRVFQQRYMGPSEVTALRKSLTNEGNGATQKFLDDVQYARKQGWIQ